MKSKQEHNLGFTLIELLVVISIIALISSVVMFAVNSARIKARDAKRKSDVLQIQKALELYYANNNAYPLSATGGTAWSLSNSATDWNNLQTSMSSVLSRLPVDPRQTAGDPLNGPAFAYSYWSGSGFFNCTAGQYYIIVYKLESLDMVSPGGKGCETSNPTNINYNTSGTNANNITFVGKGGNQN
jgi:prepilin-type N-terminal cleavage/methylation domain-containing protein